MIILLYSILYNPFSPSYLKSDSASLALIFLYALNYDREVITSANFLLAVPTSIPTPLLCATFILFSGDFLCYLYFFLIYVQ